jgi:hypothetical protein
MIALSKDYDRPRVIKHTKASGGPLKSVFLAPLFYLLPLGVGLFFIRAAIGRISASIVLPLAVLLGMVLLTRTFEAAERLDVLRANFFALALGTFVIAPIGLRGILKWYRTTRWPVQTAIIIGALIVPSFFYTYFIVSWFPVTDLFQEIHTMKGAEELARNHVLNPLVSDSYIPAKPVLNGVLAGLFGYDQLVGVWALAVWNALFKLSIVWATSRLLENRDQRLFAFLLLSALLVSFDVTNGVLCNFAAMLLFVLLVEGISGGTPIGQRSHFGPEKSWASTLVFAFASLLFWNSWAANSVFDLAILLAVTILLGPFLAGSLRLTAMFESDARKFEQTIAFDNRYLLTFMLIGAMVPLHRGSLLFVPLAAISSCLFTTKLGRSGLRILSAAAIYLPLVAALLALIAVAEYFHLFDISSRAAVLMVKVAGLLLGVGGTIEMDLGTGVRNALIEWLRTFGLLTIGALGTVFLYALTENGRRLLADRMFVVSWTAGWLLTCGILAGFPFAYRSSFFVCVFFAFALSVALPQIWATVGKRSWFVPCVLLSVGMTYFALSMLNTSYQRFFVPLVVTFLGLAGFSLFTFHSRSSWKPVYMASILVIAISADRLGIRDAFFPHTYGTLPPNVSAISHYSEEDLTFADSLKGLESTTLVISDLYTVSMIRARTGLSSLVQYSNLDTSSPRGEMVLKEALNFAGAGNRQGVCKSVNELLDGGGEYVYLLSRIDPERRNLDTVVAYSSRTAKWRDLPLGDRASYYSDLSHMKSELILNLLKLGPVVSAMDDRMMAVRVSCSQGEAAN